MLLLHPCYYLTHTFHDLMKSGFAMMVTFKDRVTWNLEFICKLIVGSSRRSRTTNAGEDVGRKEPLHIAGGNVS
jgi:hypothetical protein